MKRFSFLLVLALVFVGLPAVALADVGDPLTLNVLPDDPVWAGDTVSLALSDGTMGHFALLIIGQELGDFPFGELTLDVVPSAVAFLGMFGSDGTISMDTTLPDQLPPELSGMVFYLQGASVGIDFGGGFPTITWRESNVDQVTFQEPS